MEIREAVHDDCPAIGEVHVRAWQTAYRGQFPDNYLDDLDSKERAEFWGAILDRTTDFGSRLIVLENGLTITGFACFGPALGEEDRGELYAMNVHPDHWRRRVGSALLDSVSEQLVEMKMNDALLWTGEQNARAQKFYMANGWNLDGAAREDEVYGLAVAEVRLAKVLG